MSLFFRAVLYWGIFTVLAVPLFVALRAVLHLGLKVRRTHPALQWRWFLTATFIVFIPAGTLLEFFLPLGGIYDPVVARYWISRAASETKREGKETHVRRVALSSPEYGGFIASQAIGRAIEDRRERCVLRTILADLPNIRGQAEFRADAQKECSS